MRRFNRWFTRISPALAAMLLAGLLPSGAVSAEAQSAHMREYMAAVENVESAQARLLERMQQLQSGQVAHYDFLQFEHLEMIRHARALAWPPSSLDDTAREVVAAEASAALDGAMALEWVIADYLRAMSQVRIAVSNTLDILALDAVPASAATTELEAQIQALSKDPLAADAMAIARAFDAVLAEVDDVQRGNELRFQAGLLARGLPGLREQRENLQSVNADEHAARIRTVLAGMP